LAGTTEVKHTDPTGKPPERPGAVLERVSERMLRELDERFELGSPPPAAGSP
jgi:hypothetical protein